MAGGIALLQLNGTVLEEVVRDALGGILLFGFLAVIYLATRRFLGAKGKISSRGANLFAAANLIVPIGWSGVFFYCSCSWSRTPIFRDRNRSFFRDSRSSLAR